MTRSRAPLLELTLFAEDLDRARVFFSSLGFPTEPWPGAEDTTVDVTLPLPDSPVVQLFQANATHPPTRCALGFQVADVAGVAEALDANGFTWECPGPNRIETRWQGNRVHVQARDA